jgi:hypothetical protein
MNLFADLATIIETGAPLKTIAGGFNDNAATPDFKALGKKVQTLSPQQKRELGGLEYIISCR